MGHPQIQRASARRNREACLRPNHNGLLLVQSLQGSPRHIWYDVRASIHQSDICRLHQRVDTNNLKNTLVLNALHALAVLGRYDFWFRGHFVLHLPAVYSKSHVKGGIDCQPVARTTSLTRASGVSFEYNHPTLASRGTGHPASLASQGLK